jgi:hypothetical protein
MAAVGNSKPNPTTMYANLRLMRYVPLWHSGAGLIFSPVRGAGLPQLLRAFDLLTLGVGALRQLGKSRPSI